MAVTMNPPISVVVIREVENLPAELLVQVRHLIARSETKQLTEGERGGRKIGKDGQCSKTSREQN